MSRRHRRVATTVCLGALAAAAAGCGNAAPSRSASATVTVPAVPLDTSITTPAGVWATVVMGGSAAQHNNFWQLFVRSAGTTQWKLVTPPGTADNGGLVLAAGAGPSAITAFRPSQDLTYTPLTQTSDGGHTWSALSPLDAPLASTPAALAVTQDGRAQVLAKWTTLASTRTLAATPAGRQCGLRALTAAAYLPSGAPLLAGVCSRRGTAGLFVDEDGSWQAAGLHLPPGMAGQDVTVLRVLTAGNQTVALLRAGNGHSTSLFAAWAGPAAGQWTISAALELHGTALTSASFGPAGSVAAITGAGTAAVITSAASSWQRLPALPPGTATLVLGAAGPADAFAVHGSKLTVWQLPAGGQAWTRTQVINVPIQYGSSG
jgi:hypothetical protein